MSLTKKTNHVEEALDHLIEQLKNQEVVAGIITALMEQVQDLENAAFELDLGTSDSLRTLDNSVGVQLDGYGSIVGEERLNRDDDTYRTAIKIRELRNRASGTPEEILDIFNRFRPGIYKLQEDYPASFRLIAQEALTPSDPSPVEFAQLLDDIKAAGVGANFVYGGYDVGSLFKFASGDSLENSSVYGFGNDTGTTGGHWGDVALPTGEGEVTIMKLVSDALVIDLAHDFLIKR